MSTVRLLQNINMKQDLRYAHLVASPFQRSRRRKTIGDPNGRGDWITHTLTRAHAVGRKRLPRPSSSSTLLREVSFLLFFFFFSSASSSPFFPSASIKYALSTENTSPAHKKNHRRWSPRSLTYTHIHNTVATLACILICARAHFGSRSRNSVTVHNGGRGRSSDSSLSLSLFLSLLSSRRPAGDQV